MDRTLLKPFIARESYTEFQQHLASQPLLCDHRTRVKVICYEKYFHMTIGFSKRNYFFQFRCQTPESIFNIERPKGREKAHP